MSPLTKIWNAGRIFFSLTNILSSKSTTLCWDAQMKSFIVDFKMNSGHVHAYQNNLLFSCFPRHHFKNICVQMGPLKTAQHSVGGTSNSLNTVCKQTVEGETQHNKKKTEMARGGAMVSSIRKVCGFAIHTRTHGQRLWIFPPWDQVSKMCVYRRCVYIHVDDRPKRCKTYAFKHRSISTRMAPQCPRIHHSSHLGAKFSFELLLVRVKDPPLIR